MNHTDQAAEALSEPIRRQSDGTSDPAEQPYAYAVWYCGPCDESAEDDGRTVACLVCGREYAIDRSGDHARAVLTSLGAQRLTGRRAAEVLNDVVRRIEQTLTDHLDGADQLERLLFSIELIANHRIAVLRGDGDD